MKKIFWSALLIMGTLTAGTSVMAAVGDTCTTSLMCPGGYCAKAAGNCGGQGACASINTDRMCINLYDPVCGCDGKTYGNSCEAERVGVNVQYVGQCAIAGTCGSNAECSTGYCATLPGSCSSVGTCAPRPVACTDVYTPVCGCDGATYPNDCVAAMTGVSVAFAGTCPSAQTACYSPADCSGGQICSKNPGDCSGPGVCIPPPARCPSLAEPVCGCDAQTYNNSCEALRAGTGVAALGVCKPACIPTATRERGKACKDRIDNDCDGLVDRLDPDCR